MAFVGFSLIIIFFVVVLFGILLMGVGIFVLNKQGGEEKNTKKTISIISVSFGAVIIIAAIISAACSVRKVMLFSESHKTYDPLENSDISVRIQAVQ